MTSDNISHFVGGPPSRIFRLSFNRALSISSNLGFRSANLSQCEGTFWQVMIYLEHVTIAILFDYEHMAFSQFFVLIGETMFANISCQFYKNNEP